ncbi:MAG: hypothetical protein V4702_01435 [Patescibacteria group bacterium]
MKEIIGGVAVVLTFLSYIPYFKDILKGKTHPHIYSWILWGLLTIIIFALQISDNAGPGAFVTLFAGLMCLTVVILSLKYGKRDIVFSDKVVFVLTLVAIGLWLIAKQPVLSIILVTIADILAFIPTVRKSWNKPHTETLSLYVTNTLRFILILFALNTYTLLTALWVVVWIVANALFSTMLIVRRKQIFILS